MPSSICKKKSEKKKIQRRFLPTRVEIEKNLKRSVYNKVIICNTIYIFLILFLLLQ